MYEHRLVKESLPTQAEAYRVADQIWNQLIVPEIRKPRASWPKFDYWINSTKVAGIRVIRIRVLKDPKLPKHTINSQAARDLLAQLPEESWRIYTNNNYWRPNRKVRNNNLVIYYRSNPWHQHRKFHASDLVMGPDQVVYTVMRARKSDNGRYRMFTQFGKPELYFEESEIRALTPQERSDYFRQVYLDLGWSEEELDAGEHLGHTG